jgi:hypothetical protein
MIYRNLSTGRIEPLPWRVRMPDGSTRTDPDQWASHPEVLAAAGFVETVRTPEDDIVPPEPTPATVSARQIRLWLIRQGVPMAAVDAAIDAITDELKRDSVRVEWEYAPYVERSHPMLIPLAAALGLTEQEVDQAFAEAAQIDEATGTWAEGQ